MEHMKKANARGAIERTTKRIRMTRGFLERCAISAQIAPLMQFWSDALRSKSFLSK
jgi:hypothetical protein